MGEFFIGCLGTENGFECVGMKSCVPCLCAHRHRGRGEILYLFEVKVQLLGPDSQICHVLFTAAWVAADKIGYELFPQILRLVDAVENAFERFELTERWLAHQPQHVVAGVFGRYFQSAADVMDNQFACILTGGFVGMLILGMIQKQVVTNAAADETLFYFGQCVDSMIDVKKLAVIGVKIGAYLRVYA